MQALLFAFGMAVLMPARPLDAGSSIRFRCIRAHYLLAGPADHLITSGEHWSGIGSGVLLSSVWRPASRGLNLTHLQRSL
jgi:hypothetical protein